MTKIPNNAWPFANAILPQEKRFEKIANDKSHPLRLYCASVNMELYQMQFYVDQEKQFVTKIEAGLLIASIEN